MITLSLHNMLLVSMIGVLGMAWSFLGGETMFKSSCCRDVLGELDQQQ